MKKFNTKNCFTSVLNLCKNRRAFAPVTEEEKEEYKRAYLLRSACDEYKIKGKNLNDIENFINNEMESDKFKEFKEATKRELKEEVITLLNKFINASPEKSLIVAPYEFTYGGIDFVTKPDYVYNLGEMTVDTAEGRKKLPVCKYVDFTTGRQKMTSKRGIKDPYTKNVYYSLKTLGLIEYAKDHLKGNGVAIISFTALKTSNDHNGDYSKEWSIAKDDVRGGYTNNEVYTSVCFLNGQTTTFTGSSIDFDNVYINFDETIEEFKKGENLKGSSDCESCEYNNICNFSYPPIKKPVTHISKEIKAYNVTPEQAKLIDFEGGCCVVDAGAGSGKSQSVALHTIKLFERGIEPKDIMLLSFSNSAVKVLKDRVGKMVEEMGLDFDVSPMKIATFNGIGDEVVKENYQELGFDEKPSLIDSIENYDLILESIDWDNPIQGYDYRNPNMKLNRMIKGVGKAFEEIFSKIRQDNLDKDGFISTFGLTEENEKVWETYIRYVGLMRKNNFYDYSDQASLVIKLLEENPYLLTDMYSPKVVIVDEFQDSNDYQLEFLKAFSYSSDFEELLVVGDSSQAIYGFRGTSPDNIINFEKKINLPCEDLKLTINHRSLNEIVRIGNAISAYSSTFGKEKIAVKKMSATKGGGVVLAKSFLSSDEEITRIAGDIKELIEEDDVKPEDIAVISHNKTFLNKMRKALGDLNIRSQYDMKELMLDNYKVISAIGLAEYIKNGTTKGLLEYLNAFYNNSLATKDSSEVEQIITKNIEAFKFYYDLEDEASKLEVIKNLLSCLGDEDDAVYSAFLDMVLNKEGYTSERLLSYIIKIKKYNSDEGANKEGEYEAVALSTVHSSKGKEWKYVFGTLSDFSLPNNDEERAETWRLIYVLLTRACSFVNISAVHENDGKSKKYNPLFADFEQIYNTLTSISCIA